MIDPHVHLRDWNQSQKETLKHGLTVALMAGLDAVFEMPNTDPPLITRDLIIKRMALADAAGVPVFHGLYGGLTSGREQVLEMVRAHGELFPRMVGLKLYAGESTGTLAITGIDEQESIFRILSDAGYGGVLAVHCEDMGLFRPELRDEENPFSHSLARPPESEVESVRTILTLAERQEFQGTVHICHVSVPASVLLVEEFRKKGRIKVTCGLTPHHVLLDENWMKEKDGYLYRVNPPLRKLQYTGELLSLLSNGKIDWIESDHAPHTLEEKRKASGLPVLPFYPAFIRLLAKKGLSEKRISELTHGNIERAFQIRIPAKNRALKRSFSDEYPFDPFYRWENG
jgi:dihydroorotase